MPFCTNCGKEVSTADVFCAKCGTRQGTASSASAGAAPSPTGDFLSSVTPRTASMLCYVPVFGWLAAIIVLAAKKFQHNRDVRFHAFQGLYLFVIWLIVDWVVSPFMAVIPGPGSHEMKFVKAALHLAIFGAWIFMIIKTSHDEMYHLPVVGELAERSVAEQR
jgi:uncharacterized membrane protein